MGKITTKKIHGQRMWLAIRWLSYLCKWAGLFLQISFENNSRSQCTRCGRHIWYAQLCYSQWRICISICKIDKCIERLIDPLPEYNLRHSSIELKHSASNQHTTGHLKAHATENILQFTRIGMECWLIQFFCV